MENQVPVPTDNIFKFYALFGLLLFIFSAGTILYVNKSANEVVFSTLPDLEGLKHVPQPSRVDEAKIALLEKKLEITKADKKFYLTALNSIGAVAMLLMCYGFYKWHAAVQPVLDRTAKAQMEIAELELEKLRRETVNHVRRNGEDAQQLVKSDTDRTS